MGHKRAIYGSLRLWSHARRLEAEEDRANQPQVVLGVDQDRALVLPDSPNAHGTISVTTWGEPRSVKTQGSWISQQAAIRAALRARQRIGCPLVWVEDDAYSAVLASGAGTSYQTTEAHPFAVGDWLYFYRPSEEHYESDVRAFGWARLTTFPTVPGTGLEMLSDPGTAHYSPAAGDLVVRVSSLLSPLYVGPVRFGRAVRGDYYSPEITWSFHGIPSTEIHRVEGSVVSAVVPPTPEPEPEPPDEEEDDDEEPEV